MYTLWQGFIMRWYNQCSEQVWLWLYLSKDWNLRQNLIKSWTVASAKLRKLCTIYIHTSYTNQYMYVSNHFIFKSRQEYTYSKSQKLVSCIFISILRCNVLRDLESLLSIISRERKNPWNPLKIILWIAVYLVIYKR